MALYKSESLVAINNTPGLMHDEYTPDYLVRVSLIIILVH